MMVRKLTRLCLELTVLSAPVLAGLLSVTCIVMITTYRIYPLEIRVCTGFRVQRMVVRSVDRAVLCTTQNIGARSGSPQWFISTMLH